MSDFAFCRLVYKVMQIHILTLHIAVSDRQSAIGLEHTAITSK
ncbi:hypothetical protein [Pseudanabaena sp. PCC 6802]|nr:hypothetical protein [Pseudanabaena sp. PCC 6802]